MSGFLRVDPGKAGGPVVLSLSLPEDGDPTLRGLLSDYELPVSESDGPPRQTGGQFSEVLTVALASGGAVTALVHVLHKFLDLRRDRSIYIHTKDGVQVMTKGASIDEVERVLRAARELSED